MVLDKLLEFSDSQGAIAATAISTNVVDLGATPTLRDLGVGEQVWFVVQVDVTGTGAGTLQISLVSGGDVALQTTPVTHYASPLFVGTDMVAGKDLVAIKLPSSGSLGATYIASPNYKRYLGVQYTIASTVGAVKLSAFLVKDYQKNVSYPSGFTVG